MKILYFTDAHISESHSLGGANGQTDNSEMSTRSLEQGALALGRVLSVAREVQPDAIVFGGDLYETANPTPNEEYVAITYILRMSNVAPVHIVLGNHTQSHSGDQTALASLHATDDPWVTIHDTPGAVDFGDAVGYMVPYPPVSGTTAGWQTREDKNRVTSEGLRAIVDNFANDARDSAVPGVLFPHVTFGGSSYQSGRTVPSTDVSVPTSRLGDFDAVIAGHIHKPQRIGGYGDLHQYIGPPYRWSFNDEDNEVGCAILTIDDDGVSLERRATEYPVSDDDTGALSFITLTPDQAIDANPDNYGRQDVIRVKGDVADRSTLNDVEDAIDAIGKYALSCRNEVTVEASRDDLDDELESTGLSDVWDVWRDKRDVVPDDDADAAFDVAQSIHQEVTSE